jgi:hypothetical protein
MPLTSGQKPNLQPNQKTKASENTCKNRKEPNLTTQQRKPTTTEKDNSKTRKFGIVLLKKTIAWKKV